jgi:predicted TIM-barrel fold metal-dependent hydrolase
MIVDAHTHVFRRLQGRIASGRVTGLAWGRARVAENEIQLLPPFCPRTSFPPEALVAQMNWAGVDKAVLLQGPFYGDQNSVVLDALTRFPDRFFGAAYLDPWDSNPRKMLGRIVAAGKFCAVKLECTEPTGLCGLHPEAQLDDPSLAWLWEALEASGLVLVVDLGTVGTRSYQTAAIRWIAERHRRLRIVIPHLAQITPSVARSRKKRASWEAQIDLGLLPNVWFDCASLPAYLPDEEYPYPSAARFLVRAIERIGPQKVLWGTDLPGLAGAMSYPQAVRLAKRHAEFLFSQPFTGRRLSLRESSAARRLSLRESSAARRLSLRESSAARRLPLRESSAGRRLSLRESSAAFAERKATICAVPAADQIAAFLGGNALRVFEQQE